MKQGFAVQQMLNLRDASRGINPWWFQLVTKCQRCNKDKHYIEKCMGCLRYVCRSCQKASKSASKTNRLTICKDCWGKMEKRRAWEQA